MGNISWAAYHASHQRPVVHAICPSALLPLFPESAHTAAMIKHSLCVVKSATEHLNPGQTPVITYDQPLYALAKKNSVEVAKSLWRRQVCSHDGWSPY